MEFIQIKCCYITNNIMVLKRDLTFRSADVVWPAMPLVGRLFRPWRPGPPRCLGSSPFDLMLPHFKSLLHWLQDRRIGYEPLVVRVAGEVAKDGRDRFLIRRWTRLQNGAPPRPSLVLRKFSCRIRLAVSCILYGGERNTRAASKSFLELAWFGTH